MLRQNLFSVIVGLLPISYILGTFIVNINVLLIIISGSILYLKGKRFKISDVDKLLVLFFFYILITGLWNTVEINFLNQSLDENYYILGKSLLFLRYFFLYLSIRLLIENNFLNFKVVFSFFALTVLYVCVDVIIQFFSGKNLFGYTSPFEYKNSGPFIDEAIAGGFIQRFSLYLFFTLIAFSPIKKLNLKIYTLSLLFILVITSIIFSGNRMPLILFIISIILIMLTNKTIKRFLLQIFILIFVISFVTINSNDKLNRYYKTFYYQTENIVSHYLYEITGIGSKAPFNRTPNYIYEFDSGISTYKLNKYLGGGVKSFRFNCPKRKITNRERTTCNMHPHNYYLEILTDLGLFGFLIFSIMTFLVIFKSYRNLFNFKNKYIFSPFFYVFLMEVFPIKSSGSFFTTNNAVIIFLSFAVVASFCSKDGVTGGPTGNRTPIR